jgi:alanyl-tRNA synthetase
MTEKLYYKDAYIKEFSATVLSVTEADGLYSVVLDKTAFFPEEGGQYSDKGTLSGVAVLDVEEKDGIIYHITDAPLTVGEAVRGALDFDERYEKMQCHTAEHILSGLFHSLFGFDNVGFHLGADDVTMDISAPLGKEELMRVERLANEIVYENVEVEAIFPSEDELQGMEYRSKLDLKENVRIVKIGEYDSCACCAPHVRRTGEIGIIKILEFAKLRGGLRIHITAGRRALKIFNSLYESALSVSSKLSIPKEEISDGVSRLLLSLEDTKRELSEFRRAKILEEARLIDTSGENALHVFRNASIEEMIAAANEITDSVLGILVLLSGVDGDYKYVISSKSIDLRERIKDINKSLLGKGGGKSNMVQGSFSANVLEIKAYFNL